MLWWCVVLWCAVLWCAVLCCVVVWCVVVWCVVVWCVVVSTYLGVLTSWGIRWIIPAVPIDTKLELILSCLGVVERETEGIADVQVRSACDLTFRKYVLHLDSSRIYKAKPETKGNPGKNQGETKGKHTSRANPQKGSPPTTQKIAQAKLRAASKKNPRPVSPHAPPLRASRESRSCVGAIC